MRIEDTAFLCDEVESSIRRNIPAAELSNIIDNIGLPYSGINLSYSNSAPVGASTQTFSSRFRPSIIRRRIMFSSFECVWPRNFLA